MLWIIGLIVMIFIGTVLMCALIAAGRADDRKEAMWRIESPSPLPFSEEDKLRAELEGFKNPLSISFLCEREGISPALYDSWVTDFTAAEKTRPAGDRSRNAELNRN